VPRDSHRFEPGLTGIPQVRYAERLELVALPR